MTNKKLLEKLKSLDACSEAVQWLGERTSRAMYNDCKRGDWLLWLAHKINCDTKTLQFIYCAITRTSLVNYEKKFPNDRRPHEAIQAKEKWLRGEINDEELEAARSAARSAAWSAASAARSAASAAWSVACAEFAAWSAASAAWSAASAARSEQANIFRSFISYEELERALNA